MSQSLYWEPADRDAFDLSDKLKFAMRKKYQGHVDGILDHSDIGYLQGLLDAGIEEAQALIDAIAKHERIRVFER
jgi:hypothetical protein